MYNLIKYSNNYSKILEGLQQCCKCEPALHNGNIADFNGANNIDLFISNKKITRQTDNGGTKNNEIAVSSKSLINCEVNLTLTWSGNCIISFSNVAN